MSETKAPQTRFPKEYMSLGVILLVLGGILAVVGLSSVGFSAKELGRTYFFGWMFWANLTLGCTGLSLLHHVVRAKWSNAMFRIWEAGGGYQMLILMGLLFIPAGFLWGPEIWKWMNPEVVKADKILQDKAAYLNPTFFYIRWAAYFGILAFAMWRLSGLMALEEKTGKKKYSDARNWFAPPMLAVYVIIVNFAMTDWGMSLDPHWFSTIYGVWHMNGMALAAMGFGLMTISTQAAKAPYKDLLVRPLIKDIGHMLLAFCMIWAYFSLSQFLITWSGNLPEFTVYYLARSVNGLNAVGMSTILGCFVIPFLLLVGPFSPWLKAKPPALAFIAGWVFIFRFVDYHYIISPSLRPNAGWLPPLTDIGSLICFGGIWLIAFSVLVQRKPLVTESHPYQAFEQEGEVSHATA